MNTPTRIVCASALGLLGLAALVSRSAAQQDPKVRPAATQTAPTATSPATPVIGTIDLDAVMKGYDKFKVTSDELRAAAMVKQNEIMKFLNEGKQLTEQMSKFAPNSIDYKKAEDRLSELKATVEARKEQFGREFQAREADAFATLLREIQDMTSRVAAHKKLTLVLNSPNVTISGSDPNSVMAAMSRPVLVSDPANDITKSVISYLNAAYTQAGGTAPKAASTRTPGATR